MFKPYKNGSSQIIGFDDQETEVYLPPVGYVENKLTGKLEKRPILFKSLPKKDQKWQRTPLPDNYEERSAIEKHKQQNNPEYVDEELDEFRAQEWDRRINGVWMAIGNKSKKPTEYVYLTGLAYFYFNWWKCDFGYPNFRFVYLEVFYLIEWGLQNPKCAGLALSTLRRFGKTAILGVFLYEHASRTPNAYAGLQAQTLKDAKNKFFQNVVYPWKYLPDFFKPVYDYNSTQSTELFFRTPVPRGKSALFLSSKNDNALYSKIDFRESGETAYDGYKLHRYAMEEPAKCLAKDTLVKMYDGTNKKVQDVVKGDLLRGDDNIPRTVFSTTKGKEVMYDIIPNSNKAKVWSCNESHILSCKVSSDKIIKGYNRGDIINLSILEYLALTPNQQRHLMCYRVSVDYAGQTHQINPYLLGVWLGDGSSKAPVLSGNKKEVNNEIIRICEKENIEYNSRVQKTEGRTPLNYIGLKSMLPKFRFYNLLGNKHIPQEYLIDSKQNRLELLAGLLDTDGNLCKKSKSSFSITQKSKELSENIVELCFSLGFYASINEMQVKLKGWDSPRIYYRIGIYGDVWKIPNRVEAKKSKRTSTYNRKDPSIYGFTVKKKEIGEYYGFSIDGNRLFLLGDYTVTHNTTEADVYKRWQVVRPTLMNGPQVVGFSFLPTTIEEADQGGDEYVRLFEESFPNVAKNSPNNTTKTGLTAHFIQGFKGYIFDEYGRSVIDDPEEDEEVLDEFGNRIYEGAKTSLKKDREAVKDDPSALASLIRKYPWTWAEAKIADNDKCVFNAVKLNDRLSELSVMESMKQYTTTYGNFIWADDDRKKVVFDQNNKGRFKVAQLIKDEDKNANRVSLGGTRDGIPIYEPTNDTKYIIGTDPIEHGKIVDNKRASNAAAYVFRKFDPHVDRKESQDFQGRIKWETHNFIVQYIYRPLNPEIYYEDMIKICHYFGCSILIENQKPAIMTYFKMRGYERFIMYRPEDTFTTTTGAQDTLGIPASKVMIDYYTEKLQTFVAHHAHRIHFTELLMDLLKFDPSNTKVYDATVAAGYTLTAAENKVEETQEVYLENLLPLYNNHGTQSDPI